MSKSWQPPQNLMQAFRVARQAADNSHDVDERIEAYSSVIDFCTRTEVCRMEQSIKKQTLMFWVYDRLGEAFAEKKDVVNAVDAFSKSFVLARNDKQKNFVLKKFAALYEHNADMPQWKDLKKEVFKASRLSTEKSLYMPFYRFRRGRENLQRIKNFMERIKKLRQKIRAKKQPPL